MNQEDINDAMWNSLPQWRKDQLTEENNPATTVNQCAFCNSCLHGKINLGMRDIKLNDG